MRLLLLTYEFPPLGGGAGNAACELVRALGKESGIEVVVVTASAGDFHVERGIFSTNSTIYYLPVGKKGGNIHYQTNLELIRYNIACYRFLRRLLRSESFDLCHAVMTVPGGLNAWHLRRKIPYLVSLQGSDVPWYSDRFAPFYTVLTPIIRRIWRDSKAVVSNSEALRALALESIPEQAIDVIPNGIDRSVFSPDHAALDTEKKRIVCVGRLIERKGVWELLEAMPIVLAKVPNAHLELVGTGVLKKALAHHIRKSSLADHVTLHGAVGHERLPAILRRASLFALPSHAEGMSNALLEGISCGLPIVVTDTGGTAELLDGNGLVVPMKNVGALADAIITILSNDVALAEMRRASLKVAERYSWYAMAAQYLKLYGYRQSSEPAESRLCSWGAGANRAGSSHN